MKKSISIAVITATLATASLYPAHRAEAVVGLISGSPLVAVWGIAIAGGSYLLPAYSHNPDDVFTGVFFSMIGMTVGLTLLDGENGQEIQFTPIQSAEASKAMDLTTAELTAFNDEIDAINLINQEVTVQLQGTSKQDIEKAKTLWSAHKGDLSAEAFSAVTKVARAAIARSR